jgi:hypothetical protein
LVKENFQIEPILYFKNSSNKNQTTPFGLIWFEQVVVIVVLAPLAPPLIIDLQSNVFSCSLFPNTFSFHYN